MAIKELKEIFRKAAQALRNVGDREYVVAGASSFVLTKVQLGNKGVAIIVREL